MTHYIRDANTIEIREYLEKRFQPIKFVYRLNALIQVKVLGHNEAGNVHFGRDGWLFYMKDIPQESNARGDLWGTASVGIKKTWQEYFIQTVPKPFGFDAKYLFIIAPNKDAIYPEKTNYHFLNYRRPPNNNYTQVLSAIRAVDEGATISLTETLIKNKDKFPTYQVADSHWNYWGAYLVHLELLKGANRLLNTNIPAWPARDPKPEGDAPHDLYDMLLDVGLADLAPLTPAMNMHLNVSFENDCCRTPLIEKTEYTVYGNPKADKVLWFIGDSFSEALRPFLSPYFRRTCMLRVSTDYNTTARRIHDAISDCGKPDLIIEERSERGLAGLARYIDYKKKFLNQ